MTHTLEYAEPLASMPWKVAYARAMVAGDQGRLDDATAGLADAIRLLPNDADSSERAYLLYLFGTAHLASERTAQALICFTQAVDLEGGLDAADNPWLLCRLARANGDLGYHETFDKIVDRLDAILGNDAEPVVLFETLQLRALQAARRKDDAAAEASLREAIRLADEAPLDPGLRARARKDLAAFLLVYERAPQEVTALAWQALGLQQADAAADDPEVADVYVLLASAALVDGRPDDARRHAERALSIAECVYPAWNSTVVQASSLLADALDGLGRGDEAARHRARLGIRSDYRGYYEPRNGAERGILDHVDEMWSSTDPEAQVDEAGVRRFVEDARAAPDVRDPIRARALLAGAIELERGHRLGDALAWAEEALALLQAHLAGDDPEVDEAAIVVAFLSKLIGDEEQAGRLVRTAFIPRTAEQRPARAPLDRAASWQRLYDAARTALASGRAKVASEEFKRALEIAEALGLSGAERRIEALRGLAEALAVQERWEEVVPLLYELVDACGPTRGLMFDDTRVMLEFARSSRGYAAAYIRLAWARAAAESRLRLLPSDHVDVLEAQVVHALSAYDAQEHDEARRVLSGVLQHMAGLLLADDPDRLDAEALQYGYLLEDGATEDAERLRRGILHATDENLAGRLERIRREGRLNL